MNPNDLALWFNELTRMQDTNNRQLTSMMRELGESVKEAKAMASSALKATEKGDKGKEKAAASEDDGSSDEEIIFKKPNPRPKAKERRAAEEEEIPLVRRRRRCNSAPTLEAGGDTPSEAKLRELVEHWQTLNSATVRKYLNKLLSGDD